MRTRRIGPIRNIGQPFAREQSGERVRRTLVRSSLDTRPPRVGCLRLSGVAATRTGHPMLASDRSADNASVSLWQTLKIAFSSSTRSVELGTVKDLARHIQRLIDAPERSSLIIELTGLEGAFLQFTAGPSSIQIDHPLITPQQVQREDALRKAFSVTGLTPYETRGSDGSRFLECDVPRDPTVVALLVQRTFESLFRVDSHNELRFVGYGLPSAKH